MSIFTSFLTFLVYPIWFPLHMWSNERNSTAYKIFITIVSLVVLLPLWVGGYLLLWTATWIFLQYAGVIRTTIPVSGASMLPTFNQQGYIFVRHFPHMNTIPVIGTLQSLKKLEPQLKHGDIVVFKNEKTREIFANQHKDPRKRGGFVKRIIGVPGDIITIKNGFVLMNDKILLEPYTYKPRSTFGGQIIPDCQSVKVPKETYLVLGDNRKVSLDSRHLGLVKLKDIEFYLTYDEQKKEVGSRWRDPSGDLDHSLESALDAREYVSLLNTKRVEVGLPPLKYQPALSKSAELRAKKMLEYDDLSFEATRSGYTMKDALNAAGYSNIVYGEFPVLGYFDAKELVDSLFENSSSTQFLLQKDYQEIGISTFVGTLHGCPVQIVVQHLAGYVPPNYDRADIAQWEELLGKLQGIQKGWVELKERKDFYDENKADIDRINEIINLRIAHIEQILSRMKANQWLTEVEKGFVQEDKTLFNEQNILSGRINAKIREKQ